MSAITFVHTADIHFGMENYGRVDPSNGIHSRLLDFNRALNFCIDTAIAQNVDFFLFSGDAYKTANPSPTQQRLLISSFLRLYKAKIPVVIIVGNHDHPVSFGKTHALNIFKQLPIDGFHVISKPRILPLQTKSGLINIVGIPWPTRSTVTLSAQHLQSSGSEISHYLASSVSKIITYMAEQLDRSIPALLAAHLTVSSGIFSGSEKRAVYGSDPIFLPSQLAIEPFDYVGLGHLHRYQNLNPRGYPAIIYSGSLERIDFGERKEEKGFCLITIEEKGKASHRFIKTPVRPFLQIEIQLSPEQNQTEEIQKKLLEYELKDAIIKILYHLEAGMKDEVDIRAIQRACHQAHYIAGIIPIRPQQTREQRMKLTVAMDLPTLLDRYFENKPELKGKKKNLIEKTLLLEQELLQKED